MKKSLEIVLLIALLLVCTGLTIGLTYASCYASLCSEEFFPYETRVHIASFYSILAATACLLFLRAYNNSFRNLSEHYLARHELPILKRRITVGGLFMAVWLLALVLTTTAFWVQPEVDFWNLRTDLLNSSAVQVRLVVTGIIGHHVDLLLGLLLIPVSRNSILGRVFNVHHSTLLYTHKLLGYLTCLGVVAHGIASLCFVGAWSSSPDGSPIKELFDVYNPTLTAAEARARGLWSRGVLPTGMVSLVLFSAILITSLPPVRRRSYNTFYYTHISCNIGILICASVHASTDFYFILPGLILWVADLVWRQIRGYGGLSKTVIGKLERAEEGWFRITLPASAKSPTGCDPEAGAIVSTHPIQSYYFIFPSISKIQNHAFTAANVGSPDMGPVFLFQRATGKKQAKLDKEWTWKLGSIVDNTNKGIDVEVRVEGPYVPTVPELWSANHVVCIVGGTGLTGAYSLALWWATNRSQKSNSSFSLVWTIRHAETAFLQEWAELEKLVTEISNISLMLQVTSEQGRLNAGQVLSSLLNGRRSLVISQNILNEDKQSPMESNQRAWVYISGPEGLLTTVESACVDLQRNIKISRRQGADLLPVGRLDYYSAKWEV